MQSLVKTRHKSLLVNCDKLVRTDTNVKLRSKVGVRLDNPTAASLLNQAFCNYNWNSVINLIDANSDSIDAIYNDFVRTVLYHLDVILPVRTISMHISENSYITPTIKILLRKLNKLRRSDKVEAADHLAVRINRLISQQRCRVLSSVSNRDTSQLWKLLKSTGNWGSKKHLILTLTQI